MLNRVIISSLRAESIKYGFLKREKTIEKCKHCTIFHICCALRFATASLGSAVNIKAGECVMKLICRINHRTCFFRTKHANKPIKRQRKLASEIAFNGTPVAKADSSQTFSTSKKKSEVILMFMLSSSFSAIYSNRGSLCGAFSHFSRLLNFPFAARVWHNSLWYLKSLLYLIFALNRFFFSHFLSAK